MAPSTRTIVGSAHARPLLKTLFPWEFWRSAAGRRTCKKSVFKSLAKNRSSAPQSHKGISSDFPTKSPLSPLRIEKLNDITLLARSSNRNSDLGKPSPQLWTLPVPQAASHQRFSPSPPNQHFVSLASMTLALGSGLWESWLVQLVLPGFLRSGRGLRANRERKGIEGHPRDP